MILNKDIEFQLPSYLSEHEPKLRDKIEDDILLYDICEPFPNSV